MLHAPKITVWILIADASEAYIYSAKKIGGPMTFIDSMEHPQSREKMEDIVTDSPDLGRNPRTGYGAVPYSYDPKDYEAERFAREISERLEHSIQKKHVDRIVLVAPPHFMGHLMAHSKTNWHNKLHLKIEKDYIHVSQRELPEYLEAHLP